MSPEPSPASMPVSEGAESASNAALGKHASRRQQAFEMGFLGLARREAMDMLVHKELLIRRLKARIDDLEARLGEVAESGLSHRPAKAEAPFGGPEGSNPSLTAPSAQQGGT